LPRLYRLHKARCFGSDLRTSCLRIGVLALAGTCFTFSSPSWASSASHAPCRAQSATFEGWKGEELINDWVRLTVVPQLGGRLMQVEFGGHRYLFVNPKYKGKYFPPTESGQKREWFNYGGDKLWPLPEGHSEGQWPGPFADQLDDGEYKLSVVSQNNSCTLHLDGPSDPETGLQYSRDISIGGDSPQISFHAVMSNTSDHPIRWSMQSVTQYDTADPRNAANYNRDFWAFAPINPHSAYTDGYRVRNGLADDPSFAVSEAWFTLHWLYLENEVWLDSDAGWLAVVDDSAKYGMIERFKYFSTEEYPGKASLIFYKNGAVLELDDAGMPVLRSNDPEQAPYYMEAEINSPMIRLDPGGSYALDTWWFPVRAGKRLISVAPAGVIERGLVASLKPDGIHLSGSLGVFFPGNLHAHVFDQHGVERSVVALQSVDPLKTVELNRTIKVSSEATRIVIHLHDERGVDLGSLGEATVAEPEKDS
jgi:hypothetical protein